MMLLRGLQAGTIIAGNASVPASDKATNGSAAQPAAQASRPSRQSASVPGRPSPKDQTGIRGGDLPGAGRVRRSAQWGRKKYAGSFAEALWHRLDAMEFINRGILFAATLLLCYVPFLIVVSAPGLLTWRLADGV